MNSMRLDLMSLVISSSSLVGAPPAATDPFDEVVIVGLPFEESSKVVVASYIITSRRGDCTDWMDKCELAELCC
jgi:hypothetical protein